MKNSIICLVLVLAGVTFCQPDTVFGQGKKISAQTNPPKVIRYTKPTRKKVSNSASMKRKRAQSRGKVDLSKVPQLIRPKQ